MDRLKQMAVFVRIAERQSFTKAADDLLLPRATVTNQIKQLEARLQVRLLERSTRQVHLTQEGALFYQRATKILAELDEAEHLFSPREPKGVLRVNIVGALASHFVMPYLDTFCQRYQGIELHLSEDDHYIDLIKEGVDCVVRVGPLHDNTLVAKPLSRLDIITVASPRYLAQHGTPTTLDQLTEHFAIGYAHDITHQPCRLDFMQAGEPVSVTLKSRLTVSSTGLYADAALGGLGLIQAPRYRLETALQRGELIEVLSDYQPAPIPVSLLYPQNKHVTSRVRVFGDWLSERFESLSFNKT
ncbi:MULTISPECIES: LysR family transcriptional regulator [unclassified Vibrio]|uniref:LysR substrate-binding domain-containing protein n=1 Tax=Vibrio sp. HB236076 TaxID=3232307 RepID=A0AB39HGA2_9VIBR|nr:LysR family transcriptional regulator [Vibrio sp. HB161653]MDP5254449.1 LysR family transcriptional regulator [Vibrio sp. HB161653]